APLEGGKTSLVKSIAGLYPIQRGEVILNGANIAKLTPKDRNVSVMYEDRCLFQHKTIFDNLIYPLKIRKTELSLAKNKVNEIIEEFELNRVRNMLISSLNEKEKFQVALARLFVRESDLYLIDDPLYLFKGDERSQIFDYFSTYLKKLCKIAPVIYATSSVEESKALGDNLVIVNSGVQLQAGSLECIVARPDNLLSYRLFHDEAIVHKVRLLEDNRGVYLEVEGVRVDIDNEKLINEIYINSEVLACYLNNDNQIDVSTLRLFDINSEKIIYFN
ncbi:MAG TPA: ATP-binding cassette domain-containing protein, partial [Clostridia bacterium]|nr:ATP-binding cassette domain-containing protein [Clostridia bacterium]